MRTLPTLHLQTFPTPTFTQITPEPPQSEWKPVRMTLTIQNRQDLWRVCLKSPHARVEIPELEFEISVDGEAGLVADS